MTRAEIESKVIEALAGQLSVERSTIDAGSRLVDDLGVDSMTFVMIMYDFEEAFDMKIPDEDLDAIKTVKDVVDYVALRKAPAS